MAAEKNQTGTGNTTDSGITIDLGANSINVLKYLYVSSDAPLDFLSAYLSINGITFEDEDCFYFSDITSDSQVLLAPPAQTTATADYRFVVISLAGNTPGIAVQWGLSYIDFLDPLAGMTDRFKYFSTFVKDVFTEPLLVGSADVSTIIQSVFCSRGDNPDTPDAYLTINDIPYTASKSLLASTTFYFTDPIYLTPGDVLGIVLDVDSAYNTNINISYIENRP